MSGAAMLGTGDNQVRETVCAAKFRKLHSCRSDRFFWTESNGGGYDRRNGFI
jgi:hypothetical protein